MSSGGLLPADVEAELLRRWSEPHRHYHGVSHLSAGLAALGELGAGRLEIVAFWCHDAVHTNSTPADEEASAEVARTLLAGVLGPDEVDEVQRLVLLTTHHRPAADDQPGQRVCDADLSGLGLGWEGYRANVAGIRAELPGLTDAQWRRGRSAFLTEFLRRDQLYSTQHARARWEAPARANLLRELGALRG